MPGGIPHIHVDIETLGLRPGSVILSIGAVEVDFEAGRTLRQMHVNIDPDDAEFYGLTKDEETVRWWNNQSKEARARTFCKETAVGLKTALQQFADFIAEIRKGRGTSFEVSCCGPDMDITNLVAAYRAVMLPTPWPFWCVQDYRTLREWFPEVKMSQRKGLHDALEDAKFQAQHLIKIYQHIHGIKPAEESEL